MDYNSIRHILIVAVGTEVCSLVIGMLNPRFELFPTNMSEATNSDTELEDMILRTIWIELNEDDDSLVFAVNV